MAYFTKEQYQGKTEWAHKREGENKQISTLLEAQHEALAQLCTLRHDAHTNFEAFFNLEHSSYNEFSDIFPSEWEVEDCEIDRLLSEASLPKLLWSIRRTYDNSPSLEDFYEEAEDIEEQDEKNALLDDLKNNLQETLNRLDDDVRVYFRYIDETFGTSYAPSQPDNSDELNARYTKEKNIESPEEYIQRSQKELLLEQQAEKILKKLNESGLIQELKFDGKKIIIHHGDEGYLISGNQNAVDFIENNLGVVIPETFKNNLVDDYINEMEEQVEQELSRGDLSL